MMINIYRIRINNADLVVCSSSQCTDEHEKPGLVWPETIRSPGETQIGDGTGERMLIRPE
jgi:hypothetical protein